MIEECLMVEIPDQVAQLNISSGGMTGIRTPAGARMLRVVNLARNLAS